jgi:hypothetical protein
MLCVVVLLVGRPVADSRYIEPSQWNSLAATPLGTLRIEESNVGLVLAQIAKTYKVPIGLEVAYDDDLLKDSRIAIHLNPGNLGDALNAVVAEKPAYKWKIEEGVINLFPKEENRDVLLSTLLDTQLLTFSSRKGLSRLDLREQLTGAPEIRNLLDAYGVVADNGAISMYEVYPLGRNYSLNGANLTVRSVLNRVIRDSETKFWFINRYGDNKEYLIINF